MSKRRGRRPAEPVVLVVLAGLAAGYTVPEMRELALVVAVLAVAFAWMYRR